MEDRGTNWTWFCELDGISGPGMKGIGWVEKDWNVPPMLHFLRKPILDDPDDVLTVALDIR